MLRAPADRMLRSAPAPGDDAVALAAAVAGGRYDAVLLSLRRRELDGQKRSDVIAAIDARLTVIHPAPGAGEGEGEGR